jgi:formate dehydrogenase gamma subunit
MFQLISILAIAAVVLAVLAHFVVAGRKCLGAGVAGPRVRRYNVWERLVHLALTFSFVVLAATGFAAALMGWRLSGYLLVVHVAVAPVFAVSLAAAMLTWAADGALAAHDWQWLRRLGGFGIGGLPAGKFDAGEKLVLWFAGVLGLVLTLTMTLSMMPILDQDWLVLMYEIHRYAALLLLLAMVKHTYWTMLVRKSWSAMISGKVGEEWAKRYHSLW